MCCGKLAPHPLPVSFYVIKENRWLDFHSVDRRQKVVVLCNTLLLFIIFYLYKMTYNSTPRIPGALTSLQYYISEGPNSYVEDRLSIRLFPCI